VKEKVFGTAGGLVITQLQWEEGDSEPDNIEKVPTEVWCKILEYLGCSPNAPDDVVLLKAKLFAEYAAAGRKALWEKKQGEKDCKC
jgi:hypothetical protein